MPFFPDPYPDELLYSVLARYHRWSQNLSIKFTVTDLFDCSSASAIIEFPTRLNRLVSLFPDGSLYTAASLILNHTMFPLFQPFLPQERVDKILMNMKAEDKGMGIYCSTGLMASGVQRHRHLRYCPLCVHCDQSKYGEAYWHRIHQVSGVDICPEHQCCIENSHVVIGSKFNKHEYYRLSNLVVDMEQKPRFETCLPFELASQVAHGALWLLQNDTPSLGLNVLRMRYRQFLYQNGYLSPNGQIRQRQLLNDFTSLYGNEFLETVGCRVDAVHSESWLHRFVRSSRSSSHPLRHILVMCFLRTNPQQLLAKKLACSHEPFGSGPWPCLNAAADHYRANAVETCTVTRDYKLGVPVGTFTCSCGFIYSRRGPDQVETDRYRYGRIKQFGPVWEKKVTQLYVVEQRGLRETARMLRVDPRTIKHRVERLMDNKPQESVGHFSQNRETYRAKWHLLKDKNPNLTKTELRRSEPAVYAWLYRHDRQWIVSDVVSVQHPPEPYERVNWRLRDVELAKKVLDAAMRLYRQPGKPVRVTVSRLGKMTGNLGLLQKHISRLPVTDRVLNVAVESLEEYQVRRMKWAARQLHENGQPVERWILLKKAGLRPEPSTSVDLHVDLEVLKAKMLERNAGWP
ncbi:TnsD family transposase [Alicyclobacillus sp. SO9]|nr:TnsD family transposase [Alicyclobacillus sp. SO9]